MLVCHRDALNYLVTVLHANTLSDFSHEFYKRFGSPATRRQGRLGFRHNGVLNVEPAAPE
jgi:hypothetical protein